MGFFDKAKEFAGKKIEEYKEQKAKADYKHDFQQKVEKYQYEKAYQKSRMSALAQKARKDARASVFPKAGSGGGGGGLLGSMGPRAIDAGNYLSGAGPFSQSPARVVGKPHKSVSYVKHGKYFKKVVHRTGGRSAPSASAPFVPQNLDNVNFNTMGVGGMFAKKRK